MTSIHWDAEAHEPKYRLPALPEGKVMWLTATGLRHRCFKIEGGKLRFGRRA